MSNLKMEQALLELGATARFIRNSRVCIDLDSQENFPEVEKVLRAYKWCIVFTRKQRRLNGHPSHLAYIRASY